MSSSRRYSIWCLIGLAVIATVADNDWASLRGAIYIAAAFILIGTAGQ